MCHQRENEHVECRSNVCCLDCITPDRSNKYDFPPFVPHTVMKTLGGRTLPMSALHYGDVLEYNSHNLHGLMESIATRNALISVRNERPFVLSRSTFPGSGAYTAHWSGDNAATWNDLKASIVTINNMALFGIPMVGADICGFQGTTTEELCARWISVGAFSPFSRDHNIRKAPPQELYRWDSVAEAGRNALTLRYQLLPHLYTLMYLAHAIGATVHNSMWMHFPADGNTFTQDQQYMWSNTILFTPVVSEGATSVTGYFPQGVWYSLFDDSVIDASEAGLYATLETPLTATNAHIIGGTVVPMQDFAMTTESSREQPFNLLIAMNSVGGNASGKLFLDDGLQVNLIDASLIEYSVENRVLRSKIIQSSYRKSAVIGSVTIMSPIDVSSFESTSCVAELLELHNNVAMFNRPLTATVFRLADKLFQKIVLSIDNDSSEFQPLNILSDFEISWKC